jgi:hypothetical protein
MLNLLSNVAILDVTNTTPTVVFLDNVMEGVDGAAVFGLTRETATVQIEDNQTYQYATTDTLDIRVLKTDDANVAVLKSIVENQRPVQIAGISPNGVLTWMDASLLSYTEQLDVLQVNPIRATITSPSGYPDSTTANAAVPVYAGDNALMSHDVTTGNAALLNGYRSTGGLTLTQSGGSQTAVATSGASVRLESWYIPFPWQGVEVTASYDVSALGEDPATVGSVQIGIEYLDNTGYGGSVATGTISSNYVSLSTTFGSAPFRAVTRNISPVNNSLRYVVLSTRLQSPTAGDGLTFFEPMISVGGRTAFTI